MTSAAPALRPLRLRLTAWYAATLATTLLLLGGGLFLAIRGQIATQLDGSLRDAAAELERAARIREMEARTGATGVDAVDELHIPDRALYLLDTAGRPIKPDTAPTWVRTAARGAARAGTLDADHQLVRTDAQLRLHGERFRLGDGTPLIAIAIADEVELEDRYAALISAFGVAAILAVVLVTAGGWFLARKSALPVERSFEHMRRFMADAAHELRTPLAVIRTRADVALQEPRDAAAYVAAIGAIAVEGGRLGRLVDDLLTLARADAGERSLVRSTVYMDDLAVDAVNTALPLAQARGVGLHVAEFEEAPASGDPELLRRLILILLDNAIKFTPAGGRVTVRVRAPGGHAELTIEDTGIGIPAEQLPHVFERFYRGDPARSRGAGGDGAGLGLSIARWIVDAHGAEIRLASTEGRTTATVSFPTPSPMLSPS